MAIPNLLFVDANIWLDFYRVRNDTGLRLLEHTEALKDRLIVTYQLESEYKRNRQAALFEGMQELKAPPQIPRPGIFSDAAAAKIMARNVKEAEKRVKKLRDRVLKALRDPAAHDPVYQSCQRLFQKTDDLTLRRDNPTKRIIRRRAFRRFLHGSPPRKRNDTSIGDAINWEWMVHCATEKKAGLVIVTRDSDYGLTIEKESYINDALRQEFSERVSQKRPLRLFSRLSDALKLFDVAVTAQEEESESELVSRGPFLTNELSPSRSIFYQTFDGVAPDKRFGNLVSLRNLLWASGGGPPSGSPDPTVDEILDNVAKVEPPKDAK
jgi:PIN domain